MTEQALTVLDTARIQNYIFGSNRLQENVGASELVELATHRWVYELLPASNNIVSVETGEIDPTRTIDQVDAELIYAGGGNTVILFKTIDMARDLTHKLTRRVLLEAPGLELVIAHREFDLAIRCLAQAVQDILGIDLARKKPTRRLSMPLLGLGVTTPCRSTGLVAVDVVMEDQEERPISREVQAKLGSAVQRSADARLLDMLPAIRAGGWQVPPDFDDLGRVKGEESYIAVVHADGNGMGLRTRDVASRFPSCAQNRDYINAIRGFSQAVQRASQQALARTVELLADALKEDPDLPPHFGNFPFRPIVFGGDDVTFVCNGRYGLPLAARYLHEFEKQTAAQPAFNGHPAFACAGVTIIKSHYPFSRAYRLAEELSHSAKKFAKEMTAGRGDRSALDWHFARSGLTGSLEVIRRAEYEVNLGEDEPGLLTMRPVLLTEHPIEWRTWPIFDALAKEFAAEGGDWYDRRNKVKALREALRSGPDAVHDFIRTYRLAGGLPRADVIPIAGVGETGWDGLRRSVYFDPVEAMDFYTDLEARVSTRKEE